jgi:hypothetical protein
MVVNTRLGIDRGLQGLATFALVLAVIPAGAQEAPAPSASSAPPRESLP